MKIFRLKLLQKIYFRKKPKRKQKRKSEHREREKKNWQAKIDFLCDIFTDKNKIKKNEETRKKRVRL